jgi:hypothetical protein
VSADGGWTNYSGAIWKKDCSTTVFQMLDNGVSLTPLVCTNEADVTANLQAGQYSHIPDLNTLYYRASDGSDPTGHTLRIPNHAWDAYSAAIYANGKSRFTLQNVTLRNYQPSRYKPAVFFRNGSSITLSNVTVSGCLLGFAVENCNNLTFTGSLTNNVEVGMMAYGNCTNLFILGSQIIGNGRSKEYSGTNYVYTSDGDGIGVGQTGANISNLVIGSSIISSNGAPDYDSANHGNGIYCGTTYPFILQNLVVTNCYIQNNHLFGLRLSHQVHSSFINGNVFSWNGRVQAGWSALAINVTNVAGVSHTVTSNLFALNELTNNAGALAIYVPYSNGLVRVVGNSFYNNGAANSTFRADLWWRNNDIVGRTNIVEDYNTFQRVSAWGTTKIVAYEPSPTWDINHIIGGSAGYWQFDNGLGLGAHDVASTTGPMVNQTALTFTP